VELICDRNVADKYYRAFREPDWISVRRVGDLLPINAPDSLITEYAGERDWVVFT